MNILCHEGRWHIRFLSRWAIAALLTLGLFLSFYSTFEAESKNLTAMLEGFPPEVLSGFGLEVDSLGRFSGYLAYIYTFVQLLLGIFSVYSGMLLIGREKMHRTSDFLFSKPVSRRELWTAKVLLGFLGIVLVNGLIAVTVFVIARVQESAFDASIQRILQGSLIVQLMLFFLGVMISSLKKKVKTVTGTASSIGMGLYFLLVIGRLLEEEKLMKMSLYGLFDAPKMEKSGFDMSNVWISLAVMFLFAVVSYLRYTREDLEA